MEGHANFITMLPRIEIGVGIQLGLGLLKAWLSAALFATPELYP
jgi:hypothetical protein